MPALAKYFKDIPPPPCEVYKCNDFALCKEGMACQSFISYLCGKNPEPKRPSKKIFEEMMVGYE